MYMYIFLKTIKLCYDKFLKYSLVHNERFFNIYLAIAVSFEGVLNFRKACKTKKYLDI